MRHQHLTERELLLLIIENQEIAMAQTAALTSAVESLTTVVGEVVSEVQGTDDQAAIDQAVTAIEAAVAELQGVLPKATAPVVSSVSPNTGSASGAESVVIAGSGLTGATTVAFGSTDAASFSVDSDAQITATTPAEAAGDVEVVVTGPGGSSSPVGFTFS